MEEVMQKSQFTLGDTTPVKLGFIVGLLALCAAGFGGWIWWAATISSKMDTLLMQEAVIIKTTDDYGKRISDVEAWRKLVDTVGTPAMVTRVAEVEKKHDALLNEFELYKATRKDKVTP